MQEAEVTSESRSLPTQARRRSWWRVVLRGCYLGLLLAFAVEFCRVMLLGNFHVVVPGLVFRSAQLSDTELEAVIEKHGIRTVINLRGCCNPFPWYLDECRATHRHGVNQEDIGFSAGRLPPVPEIRRLVEALERTEYPVLIHCNRGADRTGLASAVVTLLMTDASLAEGRRQLSPRFSHLALRRLANQDRFFDLYSEWLDAQGKKHSRENFHHWLLVEYCPGECRCELEILAFPKEIVSNEAFVLQVRCRNISIKRWEFHKESNAGIHLFAIVTNEHGQLVCPPGKAGLFDALADPGEYIDLKLAVPAIPQSGRYQLRLDMEDGDRWTFSQTGQEPLERELEVR
jgi:protein tyrosine phosphatase (PTP) superfamily phosphohydrolase (DUF442 family)